MFNRERTKEVFGYDLDLSIRRRTREEFAGTFSVHKKKLIVIDNCPICGVEREIKLSQSRKNKPCLKCFHNSPEMKVIKKESLLGKPVSEEAKLKMRENHWSKKGGVPWQKGKPVSEKAKELISLSAKKQNIKLREKLGEEEYKIRMACRSQRIKREEFEGFVSSENVMIRASKEMKEWTRAVFIKDRFTCVKCGRKRGVYFTAHHIESFNNHPELRFDVSNGATLCFDCHNEFHQKYGKGNNTTEQFYDWLLEIGK